MNMKKLNIRLLLSSCLLAWAVGVAAKGNPYQYVGTKRTQSEMY